ncbi:MAG: hypothetical protein AAF206_03080 [Bacteroidota bacterium]
MKTLLATGLMFLGFIGSMAAQKMNNQKLGKIIYDVADSVEGQPGYWQFKYRERFLLAITDEKNNRMRIICPVIEEKDLTETLLKNSLKANFHTALDVKYALSEEILWSIFVHPLKELSASQVEDAIQQVYHAALSFGTTYSSTDLIFPKN